MNSNYFTYFPYTEHDLTNEGQTVKLTNLLRRFKIRSNVKNRVDVYSHYVIQSGDRPDTLAERFYDTPALAWVILHFNDIIDPVWDWPKFHQDFDNYIKGKYGSVPEAKAEVHEYRQILSDAFVKNDGTRVGQRYLVVDQTTYNSLAPASRQSVDKYTYELEQNDKKRRIKILDKQYLKSLQNEVKVILRNGV